MDRRLDDFHHGRSFPGGKLLEVMGPFLYLKYKSDENCFQVVLLAIRHLAHLEKRGETMNRKEGGT